MQRTKIIATLGPASWSPEGIQALAMAGADVFRINCSHASTEAIPALIRRVRDVTPDVGVLLDLQGPKLRTHELTMEILAGERVTLAEHTAPHASPRHIPLSFDPLALGVLPSHRVLINDGRVELLVVDRDEHALRAVVVTPGVITSRKGVNLPDTPARTSAVTPLDTMNLTAALQAGIDWVALSFVQSADDVAELRAHLKSDVRVLAKIERPQAVADLAAICASADGVMAARGDLGVELPFETVPRIQSEIAAAALAAGTVSVCATEMLESMISSPRPTRAEASDVATAIAGGFDAVMLSAETATGAHPALVVEAMARICRAHEESRREAVFANANPNRAAVTAAAVALATRLGVDHIVALTTTGHSASLLSACRPAASILAVTPHLATARALRLHHSVTPVVLERPAEMERAAHQALAHLRDTAHLQPEEQVVLCASRISQRSDADTLWVARAPR